MYERLPLEALVPNRQDPNKMSRMFAKKLRRNIRTHPNNAVGRVGSAEVSNARRDDEADRERSAVSKAIRRGGATRQAAPRRPNPSGRAWLRRTSSSLVVDVSPWTRLPATAGKPPRSSSCSQALRDATSSILEMGSSHAQVATSQMRRVWDLGFAAARRQSAPWNGGASLSQGCACCPIALPTGCMSSRPTG